MRHLAAHRRRSPDAIDVERLARCLEIEGYPWDDQSPPGWRNRAEAKLIIAEYDRDLPEPPAPARPLAYRDGRQDVLAAIEVSVREMHDYRPVSDDALSAGVTTCGFRDCPQTEEAHVSFRGVLAVIARLREAGEPRRDKAVHVFAAGTDGNWDRATTDRLIAHVRPAPDHDRR